jgi:hypothetical protein
MSDSVCGMDGTDLRATSTRVSLYLSLLLEIEILMEKYPSTTSLTGYPNAAILHSAFLGSQI